MKGLGDELSGQDCSHLLEAMDIHGSITEEDFLAIVEVGCFTGALHALPSRDSGNLAIIASSMQP